MKKVTIVGAGFAGLTLARGLLARGVAVEILEKSDRPGGLIRTRTTASGVAEGGAASFLRTERLDRLFAELGIAAMEPSRESRRRLFYVGRLTRWPLSALESVKLAANFVSAKARGTLKPRPGETIAQWGRRNLGAPATDRLLGAALQGVYAGDASVLSAPLVLGPMFAKKKRDKYRGVIAARDGNQRVIEALERDVLGRGGLIRYGADAAAEAIAGPVVYATSAAAAARLLEKNEPILARRLKAIRMAPLVSVTCFHREPAGPRAFGCLVPRGQGVRVLGVLLNDAIFPDRTPASSETWIYGGAGDPEAAELNDEKILALIRAERKVLFGKDDAPIEAVISRAEEGLPGYDLVLEDVLKDLNPPEGIWFHGNWLGGIGISRILERSDALAERLAKELR